MQDFQILPHTADLKIRVYGTTLQELFVHALMGMFQAIEPKTNVCETKDGRLVCSQVTCEREIVVDSTSAETLLVDFLSQALCFSDMYNEAYLSCDIQQFEQWKISAIAYGVKVQGFDVEIKAVTYHDLVIEQKDGVWQVDIVFDI